MSNFLMQFQSDVLGVEVLMAKMPQVIVLGAAMAAGLAAGFYAQLTEVRQFLQEAGGHEKFIACHRPLLRIRFVWFSAGCVLMHYQYRPRIRLGVGGRRFDA